MSQPIVVDFQQLAATEAALTSAYRAISGSLEQLNTDLQPLFAGWTGAGGEAYTAQQRIWNSECQRLNDVLRQISAAIGEANAAYQVTESRIAAAWSG